MGETQLYYLQSCYYDPKIGRFINADALVSTGQGILGNNMFAYCRNNPVNRKDNNGAEDEDATDDEDDGYRLVGFGFQGELDVGSYEVGVEIIVYWDQLVCGGKDPIVAIYSYEGVYVDIDDIKKSTQFIETVGKLILAGATNFSDNQNIEAFLIALQQSIFKDLGVSGSIMGIWGNRGILKIQNPIPARLIPILQQ